MREIKVDCTGVTTEEEFWQRYLDAAKPVDGELFGRNLDAFWDAIEGGGPGYPGEATILFTHCEVLTTISTKRGGSFLVALEEIARDATLTEVRFARDQARL